MVTLNARKIREILNFGFLLRKKKVGILENNPIIAGYSRRILFYFFVSLKARKQKQKICNIATKIRFMQMNLYNYALQQRNKEIKQNGMLHKH